MSIPRIPPGVQVQMLRNVSYSLNQLINTLNLRVFSCGMRKIIQLLLTVLPATAAINTTPQTDIDYGRYCGRWYEQARYENWFEKGLDHVYTDYEQLDNKSIKVTNYGTNARGDKKQASGRGYISEKGELEVSFVWPYCWFRAPYRILYLDPEYSAALVSGNGADYLWLLTRDIPPNAKLMSSLIKEAKRRGFDTSALRYTNHQKRKSTAPDTNKPGW